MRIPPVWNIESYKKIVETISHISRAKDKHTEAISNQSNSPQNYGAEAH